jgi:hypothetical protein
LALMALLHMSSILAISEHMMDSDEANHTLPAIRILVAASRRDFGEVWRLVTVPHWYPPLHSLLLAAWFSIFDISLTAARLFALANYVALGFLLWRFASLRDESRDRWPTALVIGALASDLVLRQIASISMLEAPATLALFASLFFCTKAVEEQRVSLAIGASSCALGALGIKYNYGLLAFAALGAIAAWQLLAARGDGKRLRRALLLAALLTLPFAMVSIGWFFGLGHWRSLTSYSQAQREVVSLWSLENLTFYFKALSYGSPISLVFAFLAVLAQRKKANESGHRALVFDAATVGLWTTLLLNFLVLTYKLQNSYRFGAALLPCVWLLAVRPLSQAVPPLSRPQMLLLGGLLVGFSWAAPPKLALAGVDENRDTAVARAYEKIYQAMTSSNLQRLHMLGRAEVRGGGRARSYSAVALETYLYQLCARERPISRCKFRVWDQRTHTARSAFSVAEVFDESTTRQRAQLVVQIHDHSMSKKRVPRWLSSWKKAGNIEVADGFSVRMWRRPPQRLAN